MVRYAVPFVLGLLLLPSSAIRAADNPIAGTWKFSFAAPTRQGIIPFVFLIRLKETDKGWAGEFLGSSQALAKEEPTFDKVTVNEDHLQFTLKLAANVWTFDGRVLKDGKKIPGSFDFLGQTLLVELVPSKLKSLSDEYAIAKENLETMEDGQDYFTSLFVVLGKSAEKKLKIEEVRLLTDKAGKVAEKYGPRWHRMVLLKMATILAPEEGLATVAIELARQAERMLKPDDDLNLQIQLLQTVSNVLRKANKKDDLKPLESRIMKLESRDYAEYTKSNPIKVEEFKGRKAKSDRAVLVELFVGVDSPQSVPFELAFDALLNSYKPSEVVLLEYHIPFGGFDALMSKEGMDRLENYRDKQPSASIFINGKKEEAGGISRASANAKYTAYREKIDEWLEKPAAVKLQLTASQKGKEISVKGVVSDLEKPGENVTLRFVLVEDRVRYMGSNGTRYQHAVVRAFAGGLKGFALTKKDSEHTAALNLDKVREELNKFLEELTMGQADLAEEAARLQTLKNLRVIAFIQDDKTNEVLQAVQVELEDKKE